MTDARFAVRDGLHRLLAEDPSAWPGATPLVFRGRLLDFVGSDARPLVMLLALVAERGVHERLVAAKASGVAFAQVRGPLVITLAEEHFLRPEMAQWAVETWSYALGVATLEQLTPGIGRAVPPPPPPPPKPVAPPRPMPTPRPSAARPAAAPTYRPPAQTGVRGPRPSVGPLGVQRPRVPISGGISPKTIQRVLLGVTTVCAVAIAIFIISGPKRPLDLPTVAAEPVPEAPATPAPAAAAPATAAPRAAAPRLPEATRLGIPSLPPALPGVTSGALPATRADSAKLYVVRPPVRAPLTAPPSAEGPRRYATAGPAAERPGLGLLNVGTGQFDRLVKRNGEVIVGRMAEVRASEVLFLDAETRIRYAIPKREIREVITEFGNRVQFTAEPVTSTAVEIPMGPLVRRGVSGTYRVSYALKSVTGSRECGDNWKRPIPDDRLTVVHLPGADTLSIRAENGGTFSAVMDPAANFQTSIMPQPEAAVGSSAITSRMAGKFSAEGFTGEVSIIGYRRQPTGRDISCYSTLTATATKLGPP